MSGERMVGPHPAVVISYDNASRTCRVRIPAITDGGAVGALAQICYPIGDKSRSPLIPQDSPAIIGCRCFLVESHVQQ
jgi:mRNA-degrading endonuclease toxin of MazEF toxin-antitoxin module